MDVYKHLFARDWERLAEQMSAPSAHVGRLQQELEDADGDKNEGKFLSGDGCGSVN